MYQIACSPVTAYKILRMDTILYEWFCLLQKLSSKKHNSCGSITNLNKNRRSEVNFQLPFLSVNEAICQLSNIKIMFGHTHIESKWNAEIATRPTPTANIIFLFIEHVITGLYSSTKVNKHHQHSSSKEYTH